MYWVSYSLNGNTLLFDFCYAKLLRYFTADKGFSHEIACKRLCNIIVSIRLLNPIITLSLRVLIFIMPIYIFMLYLKYLKNTVIFIKDISLVYPNLIYPYLDKFWNNPKYHWNELNSLFHFWILIVKRLSVHYVSHHNKYPWFESIQTVGAVCSYAHK